jgi:hypothetical protein
MKNLTHMEDTQNAIISRFGFLPALPTYDNIEIQYPFATLAANHFKYRDLDMTFLESGTLKISYNKMNFDEKRIFLEEIRTFLKGSRQEVIDNFLIYKNKGINFL